MSLTYTPYTTRSLRALSAGESVLQLFVIIAKDVRKTRSGADYFDLALGDAHGTITGKMWSDAISRCAQAFQVGDCVRIAGKVQVYKDSRQIIVETLQLMDRSEAEHLIRTAPCDVNMLMYEIMEVASRVKPKSLAKLLCVILEEYGDVLKTAPAAKAVHHAYQGGLIEHVHSVMHKVQALLPLNPTVNPNLALAGAILHDIGKLRAFKHTVGGSTIEGRLLGHIVLGLDILRETAYALEMNRAPWFPELEHIIASHHGELEFGAPVRPLTREALLVSLVDNLDAKLKIMEEALESANQEGFTSYNKWLRSRVYAGLGSPEEIEYDGP